MMEDLNLTNEIFDAFGWMKGAVRVYSLDYRQIGALAHRRPKQAYALLSNALHRLEQAWRAGDGDGVRFVKKGWFEFVDAAEVVV